jgi:hypothetical protein
VKLAELQKRFWELATRAEGARPAEECFVSARDLGAEERLGIYANMFIWRQIDSLREDFPKVAAALDDDFYDTAEAYLRAHPSVHPSLARLGRHLASFLAERSGVRPDLPDLAALEWARNEVFEELQLTPATADLVTAGDPATVVLRIAPTVRLLSLRHDVVPLWKELDAGHEAPAPRPGATSVAVWRKGFIVYHAALPAEEATALRSAMAGATLGEVCEAFAASPDPVAAALAAIASWFKEEWVAQP